MIEKQVKNNDFTLEIKLDLGDSNKDFAYEKGIEMMIQSIAGAIYSGELWPLFLAEQRKVVENMLSAIQTEQVLKGEK